MTVFNLPDLGEGLLDAEIHQWHVAEGDEVAVDQPLVAMETAKAVVDLPSPRAGRIKKLHGKPGDIIQTGAVLLEFAENGQAAAASVTAVEGETPATTEATAAQGGNVKATPAVRALAKKLQVDLATVTASGPGGAITADDVNRAATNTAPVAGEPLHGVRRVMAQQMAISHAEVVAVTLTDDANINHWPAKTDVTARLIRAVAAACQAEPVLNAYFYGASLSQQFNEKVNVGIAVDTAKGLYVPVVHDAANLSDEQLRAVIDDFKTKAKSQSFSPADLQHATITLSNFGTIAGRYATPVVVPPTVAIIAIGKTRPTVVAKDGQAVVHNVMPVSLTFDHRAATGGEAARFLAAFIVCLEK